MIYFIENILYQEYNVFCIIVDIDECAKGEVSCGKNAECVNAVGSFECKCKEGYTGDGHECEGILCWILIKCRRDICILKKSIVSLKVSKYVQ